MIYTKIDAVKYREEFVSKFTNFGDKAPIMLSFATDEFGVTIIHENTGKKYFYEWDYSIPVKNFIHEIKKDLSYNHYPRISRVVIEEIPLTADEAADLIAEGTSVDEVPSFKTQEKTQVFRIDKILAMKDEMILVDEESGEQSVYKTPSGIYFLKKYREGAFKDIAEAGDSFFKKSTLITKLKNVIG